MTTLTTTIRNREVRKEILLDISMMVSFFIFYGILPHLLKPRKYKHAKETTKSTFAVLRKYIRHILIMSTISIFWKQNMNPHLPSTSEVPLLNYILYTFAAMVVTDVHFFASHKLMHCNRFLYRHLHAHHHAMPSSEMEALDYVEQHPLEMLLVSMPIAYISYLFPVVPNWYNMAFVYMIHGMGLAGHSMYNFYDMLNPLFYIFLPFNLPLVLISIATRVLGLPNVLSSPSRHYLHHKDSRVNFGLTFNFMDRWTGSERSVKDMKPRAIPKTKRHEVSILFVLLQATVLSGTGSMYASYAIYCIHLVIELSSPRTNSFLRKVHHPLALFAAFSSFFLNLRESAMFVVLSNIVQLPSFIALALDRNHILAAAVVTPIKLVIASVCFWQVADCSILLSGMGILQMANIGIGVMMQVKGGLDLAAKGSKKMNLL